MIEVQEAAIIRLFSALGTTKPKPFIGCLVSISAFLNPRETVAVEA